MTIKLIYFSLTGQTRKFVSDINSENKNEIIEITENDWDIELSKNDKFILFMPTYAENHNGVITNQDMLIPVIDFMQYNNNYNKCYGIIGSGNKNYGDLYIASAKKIAKDFNIPLLYDYEMRGMPKDINAVKNIILSIKETQKWNT